MKATSPRWYRWNGTSLELRVQAQTQCRNEGLGDVAGDVLRVRVNAAPVDGKANKRLVVVLADAFGVAKSRVRLVHGARSRLKRIRIDQPQRVPEGLKTALQAGLQVDLK
jgi:hypothetical protein